MSQTGQNIVHSYILRQNNMVEFCQPFKKAASVEKILEWQSRDGSMVDLSYSQCFLCLLFHNSKSIPASSFSFLSFFRTQIYFEICVTETTERTIWNRQMGEQGKVLESSPPFYSPNSTIQSSFSD